MPWAYFPKYNVGSDNTFSDASLHDKCDSSDQNCSDRNSSVYKYNIDVLHKLGFKTCAMALTDDSVSIDDPVLHSEERLAIVLGTEGDGLSHEAIAGADYVHCKDTNVTWRGFTKCGCCQCSGILGAG